MPVLVVQIPPRPRLVARSGEEPSAGAAARTEYGYALTDDGLEVKSQGRAVPALLPRGDACLAVLAAADVGWHRITVPRAPGGRMREALIGLLEDAMLDEPEVLHFALAPEAEPGQTVWVAVAHKAWLEGVIAALEKGGHTIDRIVPSAWPSEFPQGHFYDAAEGDGTPQPSLLLSDSNGVAALPLAGTLARLLVPATDGGQPVRWTATPAVAAPAERWLGHAVQVQTDAEHLISAARSLWNLRQFELAARARGSRALLDAAKRFMSPGWRPVRIGVVTLLVLQVLGLNVWALSRSAAVEEKKRAQLALIKSAHPQLRVVVDAPLQMRRETEALRAAAGRTGESDLEAMLSAAASAWPEGLGPAQSLKYETGRLTLSAVGWNDDQLRTFRERLRPAGFAVESAEGRVAITRAASPSGA